MRPTKEERKKRSINKVSKVWALLFLASTIAFGYTVFWADFLPTEYQIAIYVGIGIIWLLLFPPLFSWRFKKGRKIIAMVFATIFILGYGAGAYAQIKASNFISDINAVSNKEETFVLVTNKDFEYKNPSDMAGGSIYVYNYNSITQRQAEKRLDRLVDVNYLYGDDVDAMLKSVADKQIDGVLLNQSDFDKVKSGVSGSGNLTILETFKIKGEDAKADKVDVSKDSFNVLISGMDTDGDVRTLSRSDVSMIMTVNPRTRHILLTSIPRDTLVPLETQTGAKVQDKLTHTGFYGIGKTIDGVEGLLNIDINYYVKVNFSTVKELVNAIGGIDINSDQAFTAGEAAGNGVSYDFGEGMNHVDGAQALAFARERSAFLDGDLQRIKNQQIVLEAVFKKITNPRILATSYGRILDSIEDYMETNMPEDDIRTLIKVQLKSLGSGWTIEKQSLDGYMDMAMTYSDPTTPLSVIIADEDSINHTKWEIDSVMDE